MLEHPLLTKLSAWKLSIVTRVRLVRKGYFPNRFPLSGDVRFSKNS